MPRAKWAAEPAGAIDTYIYIERVQSDGRPTGWFGSRTYIYMPKKNTRYLFFRFASACANKGSRNVDRYETERRFRRRRNDQRTELF